MYQQKDRNMMKQTIMFLLLLTGLLGNAVYAQPEVKGSPDDLKRFLYPADKMVSIFGQAEEKAYSDKANISLVITTENKLLSDSITSNSELRQIITDELMASGITADNIKSSKFSTSPEYGWFGKKPASYKVVNRMAISITDELHLQAVALVADSRKEVELSATIFEHTKKDEYSDLVKKKALEKVMQQKAFYESSLGVKLTPINFRNTNIGFRATQGAMQLEQMVMTKRRQSLQDASVSMSVAAEPSVSEESSFDEVLYEAGIYVDFKIEPVAQ
jgi:uncharacterized protein YggE